MRGSAAIRASFPNVNKSIVGIKHVLYIIPNDCTCMLYMHNHSSVGGIKVTINADFSNLGASLMRTFQRPSVEFSVGVATRTRAFQHDKATFLELWLGEKAPKALLVNNTIDI